MATFLGTPGNDVITGTAARDEIYTGAGNDSINAGAGNDYIEGGAGADFVLGGTGADSFTFRQGDLVKLPENAKIDRIADFEGAGDSSGDIIRFLGMGDGSMVLRSYSFNGVTEDRTKQYYDVFDSANVYQGSIFIEMRDGRTATLVEGVDFFFA